MPKLSTYSLILIFLSQFVVNYWSPWHKPSAGWTWLVKTGDENCSLDLWNKKKKSRNKYLFHMFCVRSEWQCNPRVLQGWVSRPPQESNTCCWCLRILAVLSVKCLDKQHYICIDKKEKASCGARWHCWIPQAARTELNLQKCLCSCIFKGREGRGSVRWNSNKI